MSRILIVEDNLLIQEGLKELLSEEHYYIEQSFDGEDGINKAINLKPDLILLDVNLPGKGGLDVCRELRRMNFKNPIIIISSKSEQLDKIIGLEIGADDYITKPFHNRELIARVHANLRKVNKDHSYDNEPGYQKRLCTIFFSDMKGYSEKMNLDELSALKILSEHNQIMKTSIIRYGGIVVEIIGDAFLARFDSVSSAVECACSIQTELYNRNNSAAENERIIVRIGIHLGEVFVFPDNIKGDVLNITARVQEITLPGSVFVTSSVHDVLKNNTNFNLEYQGKFKLKNIDKPVDIYSALKKSVPIY
jgi:DNA-binding response OmpR family regulator